MILHGMIKRTLIPKRKSRAISAHLSVPTPASSSVPGVGPSVNTRDQRSRARTTLAALTYERMVAMEVENGKESNVSAVTSVA